MRRGRTLVRACRIGAFATGLTVAVVSAGAGCSQVKRTVESTGTGASGSSGSSGSTGSGGGAPACKPQQMEVCYDGPPNTEGVGICKGGMKTCGADGHFGACEGEVLPATMPDCSMHMDQNCDGQTDHCPLDYLWSQVYPATAGSNSVVHAVAADASGGILLVGVLDGPVDFGMGPIGPPANGPAATEDVVVAKLDTTGKTLWATAYTGTVTQEGLAGAVDAMSGAYYVAGGYQGAMTAGTVVLPASAGGEDAFVVKLDPAAGAVAWQVAGGNASDQKIEAIAALPAGGVAVAGTTVGSFTLGANGPTLSGAPSTTAFVQAIDGTGAPVSHATTSAPAGVPNLTQDVGALAVDATGSMIVAGSYGGAIGFPDAMTSMSMGGTDVWVMKIDGTSGNVVWHQSFGGASDDRATGVAVDAKGDVVLTGVFTTSMNFGATLVSTTGTVGMFVARLSGVDGSVTSALGYGNGQTAAFNSVSVHLDDLGNTLLAGPFDGTVDFGGGMLNANVTPSMLGAAVYVAKFDPTGNFVASKAFGAGGFAVFFGVTSVPKTDVIVAAGATYLPIDLGSGTPAGENMIASPIIGAYAP